MSQESAAKRYAEALLEAVWSKGSQGEVSSELEALCSAIEGSSDLENALQNPSYGSEERLKLVEAVANKLSLSKPTTNFVRLVVERGRAAELRLMATLFGKLVDEREGRVVARLESAVTLSNASLKSLQRALEQKTGKKVVLQASVDPSLIGGVRAEVGSVVFDGTVRAELERLREQLASS